MRADRLFKPRDLDHIIGYNIASGLQTYDSGYIGVPDGVGVILSGSLAGDLIVNSNDGTLSLLDPTALTDTLIGGGGGVTPGVPEPSTWAMMLLGFTGMCFAARRRATKKVRAAFSAA